MSKLCLNIAIVDRGAMFAAVAYLYSNPILVLFLIMGVFTTAEAFQGPGRPPFPPHLGGVPPSVEGCQDVFSPCLFGTKWVGLGAGNCVFEGIHVHEYHTCMTGTVCVSVNVCLFESG